MNVCFDRRASPRAVMQSMLRKGRSLRKNAFAEEREVNG